MPLLYASKQCLTLPNSAFASQRPSIAQHSIPFNAIAPLRMSLPPPLYTLLRLCRAPPNLSLPLHSISTPCHRISLHFFASASPCPAVAICFFAMPLQRRSTQIFAFAIHDRFSQCRCMRFYANRCHRPANHFYAFPLRSFQHHALAAPFTSHQNYSVPLPYRLLRLPTLLCRCNSSLNRSMPLHGLTKLCHRIVIRSFALAPRYLSLFRFASALRLRS